MTTSPRNSETSQTAGAQLHRRHQLLLAVLVGGTVPLLLAAMDLIGHQPVLFASAASATLHIYLGALNQRTEIREIVVGHVTAGTAAWLMHLAVGGGYLAAACAVAITVATMIATQAMHPPAAATAGAFAFRDSGTEDARLFLMVLIMTAILALLDWIVVALARRYLNHDGT